MSADAVKPGLPPDLAANPVLARWVSFEPDGHVIVNAGKVELGQGIGIVQLQIAADELDIPIDRLRLRAGHTDFGPDQGYTSGSLSTQVGILALRQACAEVRARFEDQAASRLGVSRDAVKVKDGIFEATGSGARVSYWDLLAAVDLSSPARGDASPKPSAKRTVAGRSAKRPDLESKFGRAAFIHDLTLDGMVHGRMVRPPTYEARLAQFDEAARQKILALPGVCALMVNGDLIGVCAEREEQAIDAAAQIRQLASWSGARSLPAPDQAQTWLMEMPAETSVIATTGGGMTNADANAAIGSGKRAIEARYSRPFLSHASIGPSCALARWQDGHLTVWTQGQGSFPLQRELAQVLNIASDCVTVIHADGAGCYGHNGADDASVDAALLARAAGRPVRLQWSREDEFTWSPHGPAMLVRISASLDAQGQIASWRQDIWSHTHVQRPGMAQGICSLAGLQMDPPAPPIPLSDFPLVRGGGGTRNGVPIYHLPHSQIEFHLVSRPVLRTSALRALGAYANVFAIESCMDELAGLARIDPLAFRLAHLEDPRARKVLEAVGALSNWGQDHTADPQDQSTRGRGLGFARYKGNGAYCAVVVDIIVTDRIELDRVWTVVDAGEIINPDGVVNQIEGGVIQAASWTLKESLSWNTGGISTRTWEDYPILGFDEAPRSLEVRCMPGQDSPPLGVGECAAGPTAAAIANALANALGLRVRDLPLTPERLAACAGERT